MSYNYVFLLSSNAGGDNLSIAILWSYHPCTDPYHQSAYEPLPTSFANTGPCDSNCTSSTSSPTISWILRYDATTYVIPNVPTFPTPFRSHLIHNSNSRQDIPRHGIQSWMPIKEAVRAGGLVLMDSQANASRRWVW